ncbi:MAG: VWA domain-containing protein, partial [Gammaproteobacteria bacterium]|nr:VWA domain-containing protein [Gammaproteobacteria bacterium]
MDAAARRRDLARLRAVVEKAAGKAGKPEPAKLNALALLAAAPAAAGLHFGNPYALLLLLPLAAWAAWSWLRRDGGTRFKLSAPDQVPAQKTFRERLAGLPKVLRVLALAVMIVAVARPLIGVSREEAFIPSTDTVITVDISGSMDTKTANGKSRLENAGDAVRAYVDEQRRGTQNRVGLITFDDKAYQNLRLTTDYDAIISAFKDLKTKGSTAVGV